MGNEGMIWNQEVVMARAFPPLPTYAAGLRSFGMTEFEPLLGSKQAASLLCIHPKTLRKMARRGGNVIRRQFGLYASISGTPDPYADEGDRSDLLYLIVNPDSAGYVVIGPTLELLAAIHPRLPVSIYRLFVGAARRWATVYDYDDALNRLETLRDWLAGEQSPEEDELPDVEGCITQSMKEKPLETDAVSRIAHETEDETVRRILVASLQSYRWKSHCRGLYRTAIAA